jgi:hypothetical protein
MKQRADLRLKSAFIVELSHTEKEADHVVKEMGIDKEREKLQFRLVLLWRFKDCLLQKEWLRF